MVEVVGLRDADLGFSHRFGEVDEVDLRLLVLAEGLRLAVLGFVRGERDDVLGGVHRLEQVLVGVVEVVALVLVRGELLEEAGGGLGFLGTSWFVARRQRVIHLTIIF